MTWVIVVGALALWVFVTVGLIAWGTGGGIVRFSIFMALLICWIMMPTMILVDKVGEAKGDYRRACRAAGGVPVDAYRALNCQGPDGRYLDIPE